MPLFFASNCCQQHHTDSSPCHDQFCVVVEQVALSYDELMHVKQVRESELELSITVEHNHASSYLAQLQQARVQLATVKSQLADTRTQLLNSARNLASRTAQVDQLTMACFQSNNFSCHSIEIYTCPKYSFPQGQV